MRFLVLIFLFILCCAKAQFVPSYKIWQLSGILEDKEDGTGVPYAKIRVNHSRRGILADENGFYSIPVTERDTLYFYSMGYKPSRLIVKDYLKVYDKSKNSDYLYAVSFMENVGTVVDEVTIYPYNSAEEIKTALLAMGSDVNSAADLARNNLLPEVMEYYIENLDVDGDERASVGAKLYQDQFQYEAAYGRGQVVPIFDPIAAYQLLNYISKQARKKRKEDLNTWE